ncbi:hypothetical protein X915_gp171 [Bacillus phage vB_BanS-Tsamsa]|uniref:Uncharacterized protein n=1 Tax=Bacillus phage vB_BanS-Tsamsa TaxID=1308863 RepID=U5JA58_9CAUD|nr:hypothetical protein X915_gp171 [Bacillus phage vB_BanS-Tsamsa]AGI11829.1 hypothetical protein [Bacillus phage vB_BanS-Tsamsa]
MNKRNRKSRFRKFINKAILIFITLGLLISLLAYLMNLIGKVDVLAKRVDKQNQKIEQMTEYTHNLEKTIVKQNGEIKELHTMKFKLENKPIHKKEDNVKETTYIDEVGQKWRELDNGLTTNPAPLVVTFFAVLGKSLSMLTTAR